MKKTGIRDIRRLPGKKHEVMEEFEETNIDVLAISETKKKYMEDTYCYIVM